MNSRVTFTESRKSRLVRDLPCLRTTVPRPHHQLPSPLQPLRRKRPLRSSAPCLLSIEVGRRVVRRPKEQRRAGSDLPRRQGSSPHSRQAGVVRRQFNFSQAPWVPTVSMNTNNHSSSSSSAAMLRFLGGLVLRQAPEGSCISRELCRQGWAQRESPRAGPLH